MSLKFFYATAYSIG